MSDTVIRVENLSKSYTIRHQTGERHTDLRNVVYITLDVLHSSAKEIGSHLLRATKGYKFAVRTDYLCVY